MKPLGQCDNSLLDKFMSNDQSRDSKETCFVLLHSRSGKSECAMLEGGVTVGVCSPYMHSCSSLMVHTLLRKLKVLFGRTPLLG